MSYVKKCIFGEKPLVDCYIVINYTIYSDKNERTEK